MAMQKKTVTALLVGTCLALLALWILVQPRPDRGGTSSSYPERHEHGSKGGPTEVPREPHVESRRGVPDVGDELSRTIAVHVLDVRGNPITAAAVFSETAGGATFLGRTGASGSLDVRVPRVDVRVLARADRFTPASEAVPATATEPVVLTLLAAAEIEGTVTWVGGGPGAGALVYAWPYHDQPGAERAQRALHSHPSELTATSGVNGAFLLDGAEPGRRYVVTAGMPEGLAVRRVVASAGDAGVELHVSPLYGGLVRLEDEAGNQLRIDAPVWNGSRIGWRIHGEHLAQPTGSRRIELVLAGVDPAILPWPRTAPARGTVLYTCASGPERLGPAQFSALLLGYEAAHVRVDLERIRGSRVPTIAIPMAPVDSAKADVEIRTLQGSACWRAPEDRHFPAFQVFIEHEDYGEHCLELFHLDRRPVTVSDVPSGTYRQWIATGNGLYTDRLDPAAAHEVTVGFGATTILVDDARFGALELRIVDDDGGEYRGRLAIRVRRVDVERMRPGEQAGSLPFVFAGPPYVLDVVPEGLYRLGTSYNQPGASWFEHPRPLEVHAGGAAYAELALPN